jgi:hypothetical protein
VWCEAPLSCWCYGTCLNIDFHDIDRGGESHDGCDRIFGIAETCTGCDEDLLHMLFGDLQQRYWQEGATGQADSIFWWCSLSTESRFSG